MIRPASIFDVIVIGLGAMGSATLFQLTQQTTMGAKPRILGIDQFTLGHTYGSSHGETRITRLATWESMHQFFSAKRSQEILQFIEKKVQKKLGNLFYRVGGVIIGRESWAPENRYPNQLLEVIHYADHYQIPYQLLTNLVSRVDQVVTLHNTRFLFSKNEKILVDVAYRYRHDTFDNLIRDILFLQQTLLIQENEKKYAIFYLTTRELVPCLKISD